MEAIRSQSRSLTQLLRALLPAKPKKPKLPGAVPTTTLVEPLAVGSSYMMSSYNAATLIVGPDRPVLVNAVHPPHSEVGQVGYTYDFYDAERGRTIERMSLQRLIGQGTRQGGKVLREHTHTRSFHAPVPHP